MSTENGMIQGTPAALLPEDLVCTDTACDPRLGNQLASEPCAGCGKIVCGECQRKLGRAYYCGPCFFEEQATIDRENFESQPDDYRNGGAR
jgi:predicted RNA-binding Zn-ribbon protein involved in translation (DUF1610 family)